MSRSLVIVVGAFSSANVWAADLPKEGAFKGTLLPSAQDRRPLITNADKMCLQITNGVADRMIFHCWGTEKPTTGKPLALATACNGSNRPSYRRKAR
jgi:hypothetical protein